MTGAGQLCIHDVYITLVGDCS